MLRVALVSLLVHQIHAESAPDAARCIITFSRTNPTTCDSLNEFALCCAGIRTDDEFRADALAQLETAQASTKGCSIEVAPSFRVIDREVGSRPRQQHFSYFRPSLLFAKPASRIV